MQSWTSFCYLTLQWLTCWLLSQHLAVLLIWVCQVSWDKVFLNNPVFFFFFFSFSLSSYLAIRELFSSFENFGIFLNFNVYFCLYFNENYIETITLFRWYWYFNNLIILLHQYMSLYYVYDFSIFSLMFNKSYYGVIHLIG